MELNSEVSNKEKDKVPIRQHLARKAVHDAKKQRNCSQERIIEGRVMQKVNNCVCAWNSINKQGLLNLVESSVDLTNCITDF